MLESELQALKCGMFGAVPVFAHFSSPRAVPRVRVAIDASVAVGFDYD